MNPMYDCVRLAILTGSAGNGAALMTGALKKNLNGSGPKPTMPFAGSD